MQRLGFRTIRVFNLMMAFVALLALLTACNTRSASQGLEQSTSSTPEFDVSEIEPDQEMDLGDLEAQKQSDCPELDSSLFQITQTTDPLGEAEQLQFKIKEDKIQVLLILDGEETDFLQDFEVEIGAQSGEQVQAFVPIEQLCELANTDEVLAIRPSAQASPQ